MKSIRAPSCWCLAVGRIREIEWKWKAFWSFVGFIARPDSCKGRGNTTTTRRGVKRMTYFYAVNVFCAVCLCVWQIGPKWFFLGWHQFRRLCFCVDIFVAVIVVGRLISRTLWTDEAIVYGQKQIFVILHLAVGCDRRVIAEDEVGCDGFVVVNFSDSMSGWVWGY